MKSGPPDQLGEEHRPHGTGEAYLTRSQWVPPASGIRPIRVKVCTKTALAAAITTSQHSARFAPAPAAAPLTAALIGTGHSTTALSIDSYSSCSTRSRSVPARCRGAEILSRAERAPLAGQNHDSPIVPGLPHRMGDLGTHLRT